jgi:hypothetical protein
MTSSRVPGTRPGWPSFGFMEETIFYGLDDPDGNAAGSIRIILGEVVLQVRQVEQRFGRPDDRHAPLGMGRSLCPPHEDSQLLTWAWECRCRGRARRWRV